MNKLNQLILTFLLGVLLIGCAAPLNITKTSSVDLNRYTELEIIELQNDVIGEIDTTTTNQIMEEAIEDIIALNYFSKIYISDKIIIIDEEILKDLEYNDKIQPNNKNVAKLKVVLSEFDEGNGFLRFLFGVLAGSGKVTLQLSVLDDNLNESLIEANSSSRISGAFSNSSNVIGPLSKAISNFVEEQFINQK